MKVLTIKQPWAELILRKRKRIELRNWTTSFRGEFLIHSSKKSDKDSMERFGFKKLPEGQILGRANLLGVKDYVDEEEFKKDGHKHLVIGGFSKHGFLIENARRLKPFPARGKLNFWNLENEI